jgi:hypothetical protein
MSPIKPQQAFQLGIPGGQKQDTADRQRLKGFSKKT